MSRADWVRVAIVVAGLCVFSACWAKIAFHLPHELRPYAVVAWFGLLAAYLASRGGER